MMQIFCVKPILGFRALPDSQPNVFIRNIIICKLSLKTYAVILILITIMTLFGCSTPYQKKNSKGYGYDDYIIDPKPLALYYVSFKGNMRTDKETVSEFWQRRARELCREVSSFGIVLVEEKFCGTDKFPFEIFHQCEGKIRCK